VRLVALAIPSARRKFMCIAFHTGWGKFIFSSVKRPMPMRYTALAQ